MSGNLKLPSTITDINKDIGYLYNDLEQEKIDDILNKKNTTHLPWIGDDYCLSSNRLAAIWIYNKNNLIIFEVTPPYPYKWLSPEDDQNYIPYTEWAKSYKPYLITTVPRDFAQQLLAQANELLATIEENIKKEFNLKENF
jgi:hypothetical protein